MHGLIHVVIRTYVERMRGPEAWAAILLEAEVDGDPCELQQLPDDLTLRIKAATDKVLGLKPEDLLPILGVEFVRLVYHRGSDTARFLRQMGDTLPVFLGNLNHLHQVLERKGTFRECDFPVFRVRRLDGETDAAQSCILSYQSSRGDLLVPLLEAVVVEVGVQVFDAEVTLKRLPDTDPDFTATFRVEVRPLGAEALEVGESCASPLPLCAKGISFFDWHSALASLCLPCRQESASKTAAERKDQQPAPAKTASSSSSLEEVEDEKLKAVLKDVEGLQLRLSEELEAPADVLMRGVPIRNVSAEWDSGSELETALSFWSSNIGSLRDYQFSKSVKRACRFVSHSWNPPKDWHSVMGKNCSYAFVKALTLALTAQDLVGTKEWPELSVWIDKACIPQQHALVPTCVMLIESFLKRCDGLIVLLSWHYFSRLWCVYEWASFLIFHHPSQVKLSVDLMMRPGTIDLYLNSIRYFSVANCQCVSEDDRPVLLSKIEKYYNSTHAFETFVRGTAIAQFARSAARPAGRSEDETAELFTPWVSLAKDLGFHDLYRALQRADPSGWKARTKSARSLAVLVEELAEESPIKGGHHHEDYDYDDVCYDALEQDSWQSRYITALDAWFLGDVVPELGKLRGKCVRPEFWQDIRESVDLLAV
mmetsp:Transcript_43189/g.101543  ORF Transcript_43189/g.101543 Transcript_43189/m.101543 type:complete len:652 (-) Transcript_43189:196-2151(-)|eukprot:CAMPEP_0178381438 /NCGR_PEP_ID=MMETSP0689_2-20121128/5982_1 /TAXON_ID=160604 /ORGANISM="Amphidinium massartii, Strain CS-259" /LENGTH=651 /DNA_ID=CAMNT_0020001619 /DNA_START=64 /DNA_END=2019 /DNA_ORIENTATION=+